MRTHFKELDIPSSVIAIGLNLTLCMSGTAKGYSSAHWTVDDGEAIDALDISDTQPSPNISNYVPPACSTCSCHDKYLATRSVQKKMEKNLARFGYVAFVIPYYSLVNGDEYSRIGHLCNLPDSFLTILVIKEVSGRARTMDIKFSLSNEDNRESSTSSMVSVGELCLVEVFFLQLYYCSCLIVSQAIISPTMMFSFTHLALSRLQFSLVPMLPSYAMLQLLETVLQHLSGGMWLPFCLKWTLTEMTE